MSEKEKLLRSWVDAYIKNGFVKNHNILKNINFVFV